ncbi:hypothetical protein [Haloarchaeobius sp. HRN-SO-5]
MATEVSQSGRETGNGPGVFFEWFLEAIGEETVLAVVQSGDAPTKEAGPR